MPPPKPRHLRSVFAAAVAIGWLVYMHFGVDFSFVPPEPDVAAHR